MSGNLFIYFILIEYEYIAIKIIVYFFDMEIAWHAETGKKQFFLNQRVPSILMDRHLIFL